MNLCNLFVSTLLSISIIFSSSAMEDTLNQIVEINSIKINRSLDSFFESFPEHCNRERVLLLACGGNGSFLRDVKKEPYYSLDREKNFTPCIVGDMNDVNVWHLFPDEIFERVIWEMPQIYSVRNVISFNEAYRVLKPGGKAEFVFNIEDEEAQQAVLSSSFTHNYSKSDLLSALAMARSEISRTHIPNLILVKGGGPIEISCWIQIRYERWGIY